MTIKYISNPFQLRMRLILISLFVLIGINSQAQISGGELNEKKENDQDKKEKSAKSERDSLTGTTYYFTGLGQYAFRKFEDQSVYGIYQDRLNEKPTFSSGATIGLIMEMGNGLALDIGFSYFGHGEEYLFRADSTDSLFHYKRTYMQMGIPLKLRYTYGDKWQVFGFIGVMPTNILNIRYDEDYKRENGTTVDSDLELIKDGFTQFNVMGTVGFGVNYNWDYVGFTLYPEYRHYFTNTYADVSIPLKHNMFGFGLNFGLLLRF